MRYRKRRRFGKRRKSFKRKGSAGRLRIGYRM